MTIQLPQDLGLFVLAEVGRGRFATADEMVAEAVRGFLQKRTVACEDSAFDILHRSGLIGCVEGAEGSPKDLADNPDHMEGFGRD